MSNRTKITSKNGGDYFYLEPLTFDKPPVFFECPIAEYNDYLFQDALNTIPAMKIAKLAVDSCFSEKYKGIGTFMIDTAERLAWGCNTNYCAARFLTVDADIEHDKGVLAFYEKNGFIFFPKSGIILTNEQRHHSQCETNPKNFLAPVQRLFYLFCKTYLTFFCRFHLD